MLDVAGQQLALPRFQLRCSAAMTDGEARALTPQARVDLSVIIPAYNEEDRLPGTLERVLAYLSQQGLSFEILAVDDGSVDRTPELVKQLMVRDDRVRLVRQPHRGKGAAVRAGALAAEGRRVMF